MSNRPPARRSRVCRAGATVMLATGLTVAGTAVTTAAPPAPAATAPTASVVGLKKGAVGDSVKQLQEALIRVGVGVVGGVDGYFGSATQASVKAWQNHKNLPVTGVVDQATAASLGLATSSSTSSTSSGSGVIGLGARGTSVQHIQRALINAGIDVPGGIDGYFGPSTSNAVKAFQKAKGLTQSGVADAATMSALGLANGSAPPAPSQLARGARGPAVRDLQQKLMNAQIALPGGVDGIFGVATENALKKFQQANGLTQTGRVGPQTAAALAKVGTAPPASSTSPYIGLKTGARGSTVTAVQRAIINMGVSLRGGADGIYGTATASAVMLLQKANGIPASGVIDAATVKLLNLTGGGSTPAPAPTPVPGNTADGYARYDERGPRVVALQKALLAAGISFAGGADGVFGSATAGAVMNFQRAKGLAVTGKVDSATGQALGLSPAPLPAPAPGPTVRLDAKPVQGPCSYVDSWGAPRGNGRTHLGVDIIAASGKQLYAVTSGKVIQIYVDRPGSLSGNGLKIARPDGTYFFYAHLSSLAPGIGLGSQVSAGQLVGYVGQTGNAGVPHLHLEVHPGGGAAVNPYPIVKAIGAC